MFFDTGFKNSHVKSRDGPLCEIYRSELRWRKDTVISLSRRGGNRGRWSNKIGKKTKVIILSLIYAIKLDGIINLNYLIMLSHICIIPGTLYFNFAGNRKLIPYEASNS